MADGQDANLDAQEEWEEIEEEIDPGEVERVVAELDRLIEKVASETICQSLQAACEEIADLVEWEEDEDQAEAA